MWVPATTFLRCENNVPSRHLDFTENELISCETTVHVSGC